MYSDLLFVRAESQGSWVLCTGKLDISGWDVAAQKAPVEELALTRLASSVNALDHDEGTTSLLRDA
jgi:hypothetical protein